MCRDLSPQPCRLGRRPSEAEHYRDAQGHIVTTQGGPRAEYLHEYADCHGARRPSPLVQVCCSAGEYETRHGQREEGKHRSETVQDPVPAQLVRSA